MVYSGDTVLSEGTWDATPSEGTTIATMDAPPTRQAEYRLVAGLESAAGDRLFGHRVRFQRTTRVTLRSDVVQTVVVWARSDEHAAEGTLASRVVETDMATGIPTCDADLRSATDPVSRETEEVSVTLGDQHWSRP